jgi:hypothetical protein
LSQRSPEVTDLARVSITMLVLSLVRVKLSVANSMTGKTANLE